MGVEEIIMLFNNFIKECREEQGIKGKGSLSILKRVENNSFTPAIKRLVYDLNYYLPKRVSNDDKLSNLTLIEVFTAQVNNNKTIEIEERMQRMLNERVLEYLFNTIKSGKYVKFLDDSYANV